MVYRLARIVPTMLVVTALFLLASSGAFASGGTLTGRWSGPLRHAMKGDKLQYVPLTIVIDDSERAGSWYVSAACHGTLTLEGISWGYHHYTEHLASGSTCVGGAIDCLKRIGAQLFDTVTPPPTVSYSSSGTLRRV